MPATKKAKLWRNIITKKKIPTQILTQNAQQGHIPESNKTKPTPTVLIEIKNSPTQIPTQNEHHGTQSEHPTTYLETLMHLLRGNIGTGLFAMGDAFRNGGLFLGTLLTLYLGVVCVHNQHVLLKCSRRVKEMRGLSQDPDFAETVEMCFEHGAPRTQACSKVTKHIVNTFICVTQIEFCCVYFVFASTTIYQVMEFYGVPTHHLVPLAIVLLPILLPSLIMNLKYLAPFSIFANVCLIVGVGVVFYYIFLDLPPIVERDYLGKAMNIPLYFGTTMFAFDGIALVLPLQNAMGSPHTFDKPLGVLNVGMTIAILLYTSFGFFGYWRWGDEVLGSLTLNLPPDVLASQIVKVAVALGMCFSFSLQFFIPMQILLPWFQNKFKSYFNPTIIEIFVRILIVNFAFTVAALVPHLNHIISLVGALCANVLALFLPVCCQLILRYGVGERRPSWFLLCKNWFLMLLSLFGLVTGTYVSAWSLIKVLRQS